MFFVSIAWADAPTFLPHLEPESQHSVASQRITNLFTRTHYHQFEMNDTFSTRIFEGYLQLLDPQHFFFTESDIKILSKYQFTFDEDLRKGRLDPAYEVYNLNIQRRYQRFTDVLTLLKSENLKSLQVDGTTYELDRDNSPWEKDQKSLDVVWKKRLLHELLELKINKKSEKEAFDILKKRYDYARKRLLQTESEDVFQLFINAFARTIEPHTSYLSPRTAERFRIDMNLSLEGIGAVLQGEDGYILIRSLVPGGPADLSKKIKPNDKIISIAQGNKDFVDVIGWRLDKVVDLIKGPKGSVVRLEIIRHNAGTHTTPEIVELVRDEIRLEDRAAKSKVVVISGRKLGVLEVPSFYVNLHKDVQKELEALNKQGVEGLVVDLRENGGGELGEATRLTGLFIKDGPVVQIKDVSGRVTQNIDKDSQIYFDKPVVVLVSERSASASEIFAAALQDYGRALIVGENTFGKGTVQQHRGITRIYDFYKKPLGYVQYTIAKFYRINGGSTQHKGVHPDIPFPALNLPEKTGESVMKNALPWDKINAVDYQKYADLSMYKPTLVRLHKLRIKQDTEFSYLQEDIRIHREQLAKNKVSLVESERIKKMEQQKKKELARLNKRLVSQGMKPINSLENIPENFIAPDPYLHEATQILNDFVQLQTKKNLVVHTK